MVSIYSDTRGISSHIYAMPFFEQVQKTDTPKFHKKVRHAPFFTFVFVERIWPEASGVRAPLVILHHNELNFLCLKNDNAPTMPQGKAQWDVTHPQTMPESPMGYRVLPQTM